MIAASVSATDAALTPVVATETAIRSTRMAFSSVDYLPRISCAYRCEAYLYPPTGALETSAGPAFRENYH